MVHLSTANRLCKRWCIYMFNPAICVCKCEFLHQKESFITDFIFFGIQKLDIDFFVINFVHMCKLGILYFAYRHMSTVGFWLSSIFLWLGWCYIKTNMMCASRTFFINDNTWFFFQCYSIWYYVHATLHSR